MFRIFYASSDATMYEASSLQSYNTGLDEILQVGKQLDTDGETLVKSRFVVKFDMSEIQDVLTKYSANLNSCKFVLQLFTTHAKNLPAEYTLDAKIMAQPWINGTGYENDGVATTDGIAWAEPYASWSFSPSSGSMIVSGSVWTETISGSDWISTNQIISSSISGSVTINYTSSVNIGAPSLYISGSGAGGSWLWQSGSGVFNTSSFDSSYFYQPGLDTNEPFSYRPTDINMDVTEAVKLWISGSGGVDVENNGFLIKFSESDETNAAKTGTIRFFSRETHTIYVPRLTMYWDNSTFTTGSLSAVDLESYLTYSKTKPTYKDTEVTKIRIYARDKFPRKSPENL